MARKITDEDLANRGVMGLPDVPGLTAIEMQKKLEEIPREVIIPRYNELVDSVADICDEFNKLNSYAVGDYCIYQNKLYKCNTATSGDWDASKWTETSVGDELKSVNSNLEWKLIGSAVGTTAIVADFSIYKELKICARINTETACNVLTMDIPTSLFATGKNNFFSSGSYTTSTSNSGAVIYGTLQQLQLANFQSNGNDITADSELIVYGK